MLHQDAHILSKATPNNCRPFDLPSQVEQCIKAWVHIKVNDGPLLIDHEAIRDLLYAKDCGRTILNTHCAFFHCCEELLANVFDHCTLFVRQLELNAVVHLWGKIKLGLCRAENVRPSQRLEALNVFMP